MTSHPSKQNSPPPPTQSQVGGWTVLSEPRSFTNDSDDSNAEEILVAQKRKAKRPATSPRPAKSPRLSGSGTFAGPSRSNPLSNQTRNNPGPSSKTGINGKSKLPGPSGSNASQAKPRIPPRPVQSSKSTSSLRSGALSSRTASQLKPRDNDESSSSDSLPDPRSFVNAVTGSSKGKQSVIGKEGTGKAVDKTQTDLAALNIASSSSSIGVKKAKAAERYSLPNPKVSTPKAWDDADLIIISSDSDNGSPVVSSKAPKPRASQPGVGGSQAPKRGGKAKEKGEKKFLSDSDGAIDLTSDVEILGPYKPQPGKVIPSSKGVKPKKHGEASQPARRAARPKGIFSSQSVSNGVSTARGPSNGNTRPSLDATKRPPRHSTSALPHHTDDLGGNAQTNRAQGTSSASTSTGRSLADAISTSLGGAPSFSEPDRSFIRSRGALVEPVRETVSRNSLSKDSQASKKPKPPLENVEVIDLCSDSDDAMDVDDQLITITEPGGNEKDLAEPHSPPLHTVPSESAPSSDATTYNRSPDAQLAGVQPTSALSGLTTIPAENGTAGTSCIASSPPLQGDMPLNGATKAVTSSKEKTPRVVASAPQKLTFFEAASEVGAIFGRNRVHSATVSNAGKNPPQPGPSRPLNSVADAINGVGGSSVVRVRRAPLGDSDVPGPGKTPTSTLTLDTVPPRDSASPHPPRHPTSSSVPDGRTRRSETRHSPVGITRFSTPLESASTSSTEELVAPVSNMHIQPMIDDIHQHIPESTYPDDDFVSNDEPMPLVSDGTQTPPSRSGSPVHSSRAMSVAMRNETPGPSNQRARKTIRTDDRRSKAVYEADMSEGQDAGYNDDDAAITTPNGRPTATVKEPDFSKLRADISEGLPDADSLGSAIKWPAEKVPTRLHDMVNRLPKTYHYHPQMKYLFESMMEENTAEDEPSSPRIEIFNGGKSGPVCPPWEFYYTNRIFHGTGVPRSNKKKLKGCDCIGPCDPKSKTCSCVIRQMRWAGDDVDIKGFMYNKNGKLLPRAQGYPIFECNDACECSEDCMNRVIQNGRQYPISIVLTKNKGWGVFADEKIPNGTYLGIYSGEMILESEADQRGKLYDKYGRTYLFDVDCHHLRMLHKDQEKVSGGKDDGPPLTSQASDPDEEGKASSQYTIDAFHVGNFTRFLNHSCNPNCRISPSYVNEPDLHKPMLTIFTCRDVKAGEELCFSYGGFDQEDEEEEEEIIDEHGQTKTKVTDPSTHKSKGVYIKCQCKAPNCRGKMF